MRHARLKNFLSSVIMGGFLLSIGLTALAQNGPPPFHSPASIEKKLAELEASADGRIGVAALDTATNKQIQYRAYERFPMGCTSKVIGVSAILQRSMSDSGLLQQRVVYKKEDLVGWAPITKKNLAAGMTIQELSAAAISFSDNTAMNLLVKELGGLKTINTFASSIGNHSFRLDHMWPDEAVVSPGGLKDTSTPAAMEKSLELLGLGNVLAPTQRELLVAWLKADTLGNARIRAGVPKGWIVGDKTGTGFNYGVTNDIAIIWPPKCAPIVISIYFMGNKENAVKREDVVAAATRIVISEFTRDNQCIRLNA